MNKFSSTALLLALSFELKNQINAFVVHETTSINPTFTDSHSLRFSSPTCRISQTSTSLHAIGVLARKAKEMEVKKYLDSGEVDPDILSKLKLIQESSSSSSDNTKDSTTQISEFQSSLTKRKGTISVIAEYKRRQDKGGFINEIYDPNLLSTTFRDFGATAVAIMADERMGGCTYADVEIVKEEQSIAIGDMPGPLYVISSDLIVDDVQIARSAHAGAQAIVVSFDVVGKERVKQFIQSARVLEMDVIVSVDDMDQAQSAVDVGATILMIKVSSALEDMTPEIRIEGLDALKVPDDTAICRIANILPRDDSSLQEVEDAWICRDKGFQAVWASEFLYKSGNNPVEHPGAIINSLKSKSSVKWASPKARSGKGEGAREYLGDIMM